MPANGIFQTWYSTGAPKMKTVEFLSLLFGHPALDGLHLSIWDKQTKRTDFFELPDIDSAAANAEARADKNDVYFGVCPYVTVPEAGRGSEDIAGALVGVWLDVDVFHPEAHKAANLPPTREAAFDLLYEMPTRPSVVISSGYGLQGWWVFEEPFLIRNDADRLRAKRLALGWNLLAQLQGKKHGWHVDNVGDLARVLRLPGTWNRKGENARKVEVVK